MTNNAYNLHTWGKNYSDLVLNVRPWPQGALRPNFMALALRAALTIFGINLKLK